MANQKKIAKYRKLIIEWLKAVEKLEGQLQNERSEKKIKKLEEKLDYCKSMVIANGRFLGKQGGDLNDIMSLLSPRQQAIINELFSYGLNADDMIYREERRRIIDRHKKKIHKLQEAYDKYPPYDPGLPIEQKLESEIYKLEKDLGEDLFNESDKENKVLYSKDWNYLEHMSNSTEFTLEEREIMDRCYLIGKEYHESGLSFTDRAGERLINAQAKSWCKTMYKKAFPILIKGLNPDRNFSHDELMRESKELTKGLIEFVIDEDLRKPYEEMWNELYNDVSLQDCSNEERENIILAKMVEKVEAEKAIFMFLYVDFGEKQHHVFDVIKNYTYEELGLE